MNETSAPPLTNLDGKKSHPRRHQHRRHHHRRPAGARAASRGRATRKACRCIGADGVNVSDGFYTIGGNNAAGVNVTSNFAALSTAGNPVSAANVVYLYAVKHDPFAYFKSVQEGNDPRAEPAPRRRRSTASTACMPT